MGKACWACKKRKVRCNLKSPTCSNCVRAGTICRYGVQLSWPRKGDARRSVVLDQSHHQPSIGSKNSPDVNFYFLCVEFGDFLLHDRLLSGHHIQPTDLIFNRQHQNGYGKSEHVPRWLSWIPSEGHVFDSTLISHYEQVVATTLTSSDDARFKGLLLSMSFIDSSLSSVAVRHALYALTALHLYEFDKAMQFRAKAISALLGSSHSSWGIKDQLQNIATGLLLSLFETYDSSEIQYDWARFTCSAKMAAHHAYSADQVYDGDARTLLEWLFYHDALARFSTQHWAKKTLGMEKCAKDNYVRRAAMLCGGSSKIIPTVGCSAEVLEAIASACDYALPPRQDSECNAVEHAQAVELLERKLMYANQYVLLQEEPETLPQDDPAKKIAELYRLAGLVYLYRACKGLLSTSSRVKSAVEAGFSIFAGLATCDRAFPLVILGCEAQNDEQRVMVLDLLRRTRESRKIGNFSMAQQFIEASWVQDALSPDETLHYGEKFDAIMSMNKHLPCFT